VALPLRRDVLKCRPIGAPDRLRCVDVLVIIEGSVYKRIARCIVLLLVVIPRPAIVAQVGSLDRATVEEALEFGIRGNPSPYKLHMGPYTGGLERWKTADPRLAAGAVYTPFVRIAMLSKAAHLQGHRLTAAELPPEVTNPVAFIAVRWYCLNDDCSVPATTVPVGVRLTPNSPCYCGPNLPAPGAVMPLWVTRSFGFLEAFGVDTPTLAVAVAAFPMGSIKSGYWVTSCAGTDPFQCDSSRAGLITSDDISSWR
jgi:hypothetical protein